MSDLAPPLSGEELSALEEVARKASTGPWTRIRQDANGDHIAAFNPVTALRLLSIITGLRAQVETARNTAKVNLAGFHNMKAERDAERARAEASEAREKAARRALEAIRKTAKEYAGRTELTGLGAYEACDTIFKAASKALRAASTAINEGTADAT